MELKNLMSGIAVVIDDKISRIVAEKDGSDVRTDPIVEIVERIEKKWNLPFCKVEQIPSEETWPNLFQAASFILLDWKLWPSSSSQLEEIGVKKNIRFLEHAKDYFVPVLIFTNESLEDVKHKLPETIYKEESPGKNFIFIRGKASMLSGHSLDFSAIEEWISKNASVYVLKTWEQAFYAAKKELFGSMYARSPDWPKVFWKAYSDDSVDPSSSLTHLINDSLLGRMQTNAFDAKILATPPAEVPREDLQALIGETSFRSQETLPENEIRCGDLFKQSNGKFLLNLRPDCDCVPRHGQNIDRVKLYCVEGEEMNDKDIGEKYRNGHFEERVWESIAFAACEGKSVRFGFNKLRVKRFAEIKNQRVGRLLHPYLTRIQQRYGLYLQRQGLPRIPEAAVPWTEDSNDNSCDMSD